MRVLSPIVLNTRFEAGSWQLAAGGWRLAAGSWRLAAGGWRLAAGGWRPPINKDMITTMAMVHVLRCNFVV